MKQGLYVALLFILVINCVYAYIGQTMLSYPYTMFCVLYYNLSLFLFRVENRQVVDLRPHLSIFDSSPRLNFVFQTSKGSSIFVVRCSDTGFLVSIFRFWGSIRI